MCGTASGWVKISLVVLLCAFILGTVGWSTYAWMVYEPTNSGSLKVGLWRTQLCDSAGSCSEATTPTSYKTDTFRGAQAVMTIAFVFLVLTPIVVCVYVYYERLRTWKLAVACMFLCFFTGLLVLIGMIIWLVYVWSPFVVSWSFGLMVSAGILTVVGGLLFIPDVEDREEDFYDMRNRRRSSDDDDYEAYRRRSVTPESPKRIRLRSDSVSPYPNTLAPPSSVWMGY